MNPVAGSSSSLMGMHTNDMADDSDDDCVEIKSEDSTDDCVEISSDSESDDSIAPVTIHWDDAMAEECSEDVEVDGPQVEIELAGETTVDDMTETLHSTVGQPHTTGQVGSMGVAEWQMSSPQGQMPTSQDQIPTPQSQTPIPRGASMSEEQRAVLRGLMSVPDQVRRRKSKAQPTQSQGLSMSQDQKQILQRLMMASGQIPTVQGLPMLAPEQEETLQTLLRQMSTEKRVLIVPLHEEWRDSNLRNKGGMVRLGQVLLTSRGVVIPPKPVVPQDLAEEQYRKQFKTVQQASSNRSGVLFVQSSLLTPNGMQENHNHISTHDSELNNNVDTDKYTVQQECASRSGVLFAQSSPPNANDLQENHHTNMHNSKLNNNIVDAERKNTLTCFCGRTFKTLKEIQVHTLQHVKPKSLVCTICYESYDYIHQLSEHVDAHLGVLHRQAGQLFLKCYKCMAIFTSNEELRDHLEGHLKRVIQCVFCPLQFNCEIELLSHVSERHKDSEGQSLKNYEDHPSKTSLEGHNFETTSTTVPPTFNTVDLSSGQLAPYTCILCKFSTSDKHDALSHMMKNHKTWTLENSDVLSRLLVSTNNGQFAGSAPNTISLPKIQNSQSNSNHDHFGVSVQNTKSSPKTQLSRSLLNHDQFVVSIPNTKSSPTTQASQFNPNYNQPTASGSNTTSSSSSKKSTSAKRHSKLECKECGLKFKNLKSLNMHRKIGEHRCRLSPEVFIVPGAFKNHLKTHPDGYSSCELNPHPQDDQSPNHLKYHGNVRTCESYPHYQEDPSQSSASPYRCAVCYVNFASLGQLKRHKEYSHIKFDCNFCNYNFESQCSLTYHARVRHKMRILFNCQVCFMNFPLKADLHDHLTESMTGHRCPICCELFETVGECLSHTAEHHHLKDWGECFLKLKLKCGLCGRMHRTHDQVRSHMKYEHLLSSTVCCVCGRDFRQNHRLKKHMRTHAGGNGSNKNKPFVCDFCGKVFINKPSFYSHSWMHLDKLPYKCGVCSEMFVKHKWLLAHVKCHKDSDSTTKLFGCGLCNETFHTGKELLRHWVVHESYLTFLLSQKMQVVENGVQRTPSPKDPATEVNVKGKHIGASEEGGQKKRATVKQVNVNSSKIRESPRKLRNKKGARLSQAKRKTSAQVLGKANVSAKSVIKERRLKKTFAEENEIEKSSFKLKRNSVNITGLKRKSLEATGVKRKCIKNTPGQKSNKNTQNKDLLKVFSELPASVNPFVRLNRCSDVCVTQNS